MAGIKMLEDTFKPHGILTFAVNFLAHWERHLFENLNGIFLRRKVCLCYGAKRMYLNNK